MSVYVLKLLSLRKMSHFQYLYIAKCEEMTTLLIKATSNYENIIFMGDFNIDIKCKGVGLNNLSDFCDFLHLTSIVKG